METPIGPDDVIDAILDREEVPAVDVVQDGRFRTTSQRLRNNSRALLVKEGFSVP
jgi:hypothetical protein